MRPVAFVILLLVAVAVPLRAQQMKTCNQYVCGIVEPLTGLVTIRINPGLNTSPILSFPQKSFLSVMIGDRIFTNNNVGTNIASDPRFGGLLQKGVNQKTGDTIRTTWANMNGCDIIQDVYPVSLEASGQIVIKWKVKNNKANIPIWAQAQFLLDVQVGDQNPNDGAPILTRYGYRPIWESYNTASTYGIPWYFAAFENILPNPPTFSPGITGVGYTHDVNYKLGLKKPSQMTVGDWGSPLGNALVDPLWGLASNIQWGSQYKDAAILFQWDGVGIPGNGTTEIARTSYGTGEGVSCDGKLFSFVLSPLAIRWKSTKYQPDTLLIDYYVFNPYSPLPNDPNYGPPYTNTYLTIHCGPNLRVIYPDTSQDSQKSQRQQVGPAGGYIPQYGVGTASWRVVADKAIGCSGSIDSWLKFTGDAVYGGNQYIVDTCTLPLKIDCVTEDFLPPIADNLKIDTFSRSFDVHDNRAKDTGLDTITWVPRPGSNTDTTKFRVVLPTYSHCSKGLHTVRVEVKDTTKSASGCYDFTLRDCQGNDTLYTVCLVYVVEPPPPDTLPPVISVITSKPGDTTRCRHLCDSVLVTETRKHDSGLKSVMTLASANMQVTYLKPLAEGDTVLAITICVIDSTRDGSLTIRAADKAGNYTDSTFCYKALPSGVSDLPPESGTVELIGNPATEKTVLRILLNSSQTVAIRVIDIAGKEMSAERVVAGVGTTDIPIATSSLAAGTYYVIAEFGGRQYAKKLSVIK